MVRVPVSVNPVTGELRAVNQAEGHRDGSIRVSDKYLYAARDAGLGGATGMYGHLKVFQKTGADVSHSTYDGPAGEDFKDGHNDRSGKSFLVSKGHGAKPDTDTAPGRPRIRQMIQGRGRAVGSSAASGSEPHSAHASSFERSKGVVNTLHGAQTVNRERTAKDGGAPAARAVGPHKPAGVNVSQTKKGGVIMSLKTTSSGSAGEASRTRGGAVMPGMVADGIRVMAPSKRAGGPPSNVQAKVDSGAAAAPAKPPVRRAKGTENVLGGGPATAVIKSSGRASGAAGSSAADMRAARLAYFEKHLENEAP